MARPGPFVVDVTPLRKQPGTVMRASRTVPLAALALELSEVRVPEGAEVEVEAELAWAAVDVVVTATVRAPWAGTCRRCLEPAGGVVEAEVREVYEPGSDGEETYRLDGSRVDLEPLVRDAVLLGLPPAPLCDEGCGGLCPTCGANRTDGPCGCESSSGDPRWAALDDLHPTT